MRIYLITGLFICLGFADGKVRMQDSIPCYCRDNMPMVLSYWDEVWEEYGGPHPWTSFFGVNSLFQQWIARMKLAEANGREKRIKVGQQFEKYVVDNGIEPFGRVGTTLPIPGSEPGDYDMVLSGVISLMGLFQNDSLLLTNKTYVYLLKNVIHHWGQVPRRSFKVFLFKFMETENHIIMSESIRYLTNQFLNENPRNLSVVDSIVNSLKLSGVVVENKKGNIHSFLLRYMQGIIKHGFFEFNALIYQRFTIHGLNNLYSFSSDSSIVNASGSLLDYLAIKFAFQSIGPIRYGPHRRSSERFDDPSLINHDAAVSFFTVQAYNFSSTRPFVSKAFWNKRWAHASMALYSCMLSYRIPDPVSEYIQNRKGSFWMRNRLKYLAGKEWKQTNEAYFRTRHVLISAGGKYQTFTGANFPTPNRYFQNAPWVYDVISRSSSMILSPSRHPSEWNRDILHAPGDQWKSDNLAVYRNFIFVSMPAPQHNSNLWPIHVPETWYEEVLQSQSGNWELKFYRLKSIPAFLITGRHKPEDTWFSYKWQKFVRGFAELKTFGSNNSKEQAFGDFVQEVLQQQPVQKNKRALVWKLNTGETLWLNKKYSDKGPGIKKIEFPDRWVENKARHPYWRELVNSMLLEQKTATNLPDAFKKPDKSSASAQLMEVWKINQTDQLDGERVVLADGQGRLRVENRRLGQFHEIDFLEWWNPGRVTGELENQSAEF